MERLTFVEHPSDTTCRVGNVPTVGTAREPKQADVVTGFVYGE